MQSGSGAAGGVQTVQEPMGFRYVHHVFEDVEVTENIVYGTATTAGGDQIELRLDIYEPAGDTAEQRPAMMWMFGGAWIAGDRQQMAAYAEDSARRGYVGVTIDYRIRPGAINEIVDAAWDAYDDSVAAAEWLADNAADYGIDPDAIVAGGVSAGAINALHLLYAPGTRGPDDSPVAGAVSISGLSFVASPEDRGPAIMHHALDDPVVSYENGQNACNSALDAGNQCWLTTYETGGHGIAGSEAPYIQIVSGLQIFAYVLAPQGYEIELLPLAA